MRTEIIQVICAVIGSFGFSFIFHLKRDKLIVASVGGGLTWLFYLLVVHRVNGEFAAYFLATVFATFYAELMARVKKAPATIFVITALIPLIPGNDEEQSGGNRDVSACDRHGDHDRYHAPGSVFAGHAGVKAQTCEKMLKTGMAYAIISKVAVIYA